MISIHLKQLSINCPDFFFYLKTLETLNMNISLVEKARILISLVINLLLISPLLIYTLLK